MEIIQELPASLINSKQISDSIPKEKVDLWKIRCQQEYCNLLTSIFFHFIILYFILFLNAHFICILMILTSHIYLNM